MSTMFNGSARLQETFKRLLESLQQQQVVQRIWDRDASLWKKDAAIQEMIKNRLGWLTVANLMQEKSSEVTDFVNTVRQEGYTTAVLLGMGGSSLCPEVLLRTFGTAPGYLNLLVLDTTDADTIHAIEQQIEPARTLFIVASKSGHTLETMAHCTYFYDRIARLKGENAGENFIAITDPGTSLEKLARDRNFRHTFINPADIGGRYSALSFFGVVPGALIGVDIKELLSRAQACMQACQSEVSSEENPGSWLGVALHTLYRQGRDKITFILSPEIHSFGIWIEQMLAESTGKEGQGLVPIADESIGSPEVYGHDRLFIYLHLHDDNHTDLDNEVRLLEAAGQPVIHIRLEDRADLGWEFFRWEFVTAIVGYLLELNPFDEPNVRESKNNTKRILAQYQDEGHLPEIRPLVSTKQLEIYGKELDNNHSLSSYLALFLHQVHDGDYIAIMAYVQDTLETGVALQSLRIKLRDTYRVATTLGYGPRVLHSTGQLHKGGASNGVYIQITTDVQQDIPIPGEPYTFGVLKDAQAIADLFSLDSYQRRFIRIHVIGDVVQGLEAIELAD